MKPELKLTDLDEKIWRNELADFVPDTVFDAHTHIWSNAHEGRNTQHDSPLRWEISLRDLDEWSRAIWPGRKLGYVPLPTPLRDIDFDGHNDWVIDQIKNHAVGIPLPVVPTMLVTPAMSKEEVETRVKRDGVRVLKPYRVFANDPRNGAITDFFPERFMEVANDHNLTVMMHLSKETGPADEDNLHDLKRFTTLYPGMTWILAHCARAFNSAHLEHSVHRLATMENVFVDTSAVNDTYSHYLLLKHFDRKKILFGSDNVAAGLARTKYITFGYGWEAYTPKEALEHCDSRCTFVVYEQLRCQKHAADMVGLTSSELEDIFSRNALRLFGKP
ncbi:MAG: amidohydrolase [Spirochaetaceae bacterium]|nr:MAG: amidohydrolase [Spirochaetaceae bacterium]